MPDAPIHTAFYWPEACAAELASLDIRPLALDRVPGLRRHHRAALPVLPLAFGRLHLDADVVLCASSGWAAGARTTGRKIIYFHSLARWLYEPDTYVADQSSIAKAGNRLLRPWLLRWDKAAVRSGDQHFAQSAVAAETASELYGIDVGVLPPPVVVRPDGPLDAVDGLEPGFVLCPCRLMKYKNVDVVIDAFRSRPDDTLVVAGGGPEETQLRARAPANVRLVGAMDDRQMRWLYQSCRAVVTAAIEPFGLITLEANAFGKPVAALDHGGFRDTVVAGVTGVRFAECTAEAVAEAIDKVDALDPDAAALVAHADQWSEARFIERLRKIVAAG